LNQTANILFYTTPKSAIKLEVFFEDETFWLNQKRMAELFGVNTPAINKHISNIIAEGELDESTISKKEIVQQEGARTVKRSVDFYRHLFSVQLRL
jgi:hypothetical protein